MKEPSAKKLWLVLLVAMTTMFAVDASAQTADSNKPYEVKNADGEKLSPDDPMYWATVRGIQTIQKRTILKDGRLALTAYAGLIPNNIFEQYFPVGARLNYYLLESLSIELSGAYAFGRETDLRKYVEDDQGINASGVLLGDVQIAHVTFGVTYSLLFGKTAWRNKSVQYFDVYVFGGVGAVIKETTADFGREPETSGDVEGSLGIGLQYFLNKDMALRVDYRQFIFPKVTGGVANPSEISLGFSYYL